ncbi:MAG: hypothetical protein ACOX7C_00635 [Brevefilum sp.]
MTEITPMWLLGLIGQLSKQSFPMEYQPIWEVKQQEIIRELKKCFFGIEFSNQMKEILKSKIQHHSFRSWSWLIRSSNSFIIGREVSRLFNINSPTSMEPACQRLYFSASK